MQLEGPIQIQEAIGIRTQRHNALGPVGQREHRAAVRVPERKRQGRKTDYQLKPQDQQDRDIAAVAGEPDAWIEQSPMQQQAQADKTHQARSPARVDGHQLLVLGRDEMFVNPVWRQQPGEVAEEQEQDADMKQIAAPAQRSCP